MFVLQFTILNIDSLEQIHSFEYHNNGDRIQSKSYYIHQDYPIIIIQVCNRELNLIRYEYSHHNKQIDYCIKIIYWLSCNNSTHQYSLFHTYYQILIDGE